MPIPRQQDLPGLGPPAYGRKPSTLTEQFADFDREHPWVYAALERLAAERLTTGAARIGMKGLNNNYTAFYARQLLAAHPEWLCR